MSSRKPAAAVPVSLYVHVPFCASKCGYCDFYSLPGAIAEVLGVAETMGDAFIRSVPEALTDPEVRELLADVPTLYFGGGTPTLLGEPLAALVAEIRELVGLRADAEVTVETNPDSTTAEVVAALVEAGVNRFSLGVQSFDDEVLRTLGRAHDVASARRALAVLRDADVPFSLDLVCGVPGQDYVSWDRSLEEAVASGAHHISVYPLTLETGTPMGDAVEAGTAPSPDPDLAADMMLAADVALAAAGMPRYEVANYAQPGHEARHNLVYWTGGAYLGLGPGAASMLPIAAYRRHLPVQAERAGCGLDAARTRWMNPPDLHRWLEHGLDDEQAEVECLDADEVAREDVMLGLRLKVGVAQEQAASAGVTGQLEALALRGLVELADCTDGARWRTTEQGWLLGNQVFGAIWSPA